jgi:hypothetical protein
MIRIKNVGVTTRQKLGTSCCRDPRGAEEKTSRCNHGEFAVASENFVLWRQKIYAFAEKALSGFSFLMGGQAENDQLIATSETESESSFLDRFQIPRH